MCCFETRLRVLGYKTHLKSRLLAEELRQEDTYMAVVTRYVVLPAVKLDSKMPSHRRRCCDTSPTTCHTWCTGPITALAPCGPHVTLF